jgi:hypothetical protein
MDGLYNKNYKILKKLQKTLEDGKTSHVHGLAEWILWKWLYYQKQSTDSMQSPSEFQSFFIEIEKKS